MKTPLAKPVSRVKVFVRLRPLSLEEEQNGVECVWTVSPDKKELFFRQILSQNFGSSRLRRIPCLSFNGCFDCHDDTGVVYEHAALPLVHKVLQGIDCCILAYGQTGSGKSYSVFGGAGEEGILMRSMRDISRFISNHEWEVARNGEASASLHYDVRVSFVEVYMEKVNDLLQPMDGSSSNGTSKLRVKKLPHTKAFQVENLCEVNVESCADLERVLIQSHVIVFVRLVASSDLCGMGGMGQVEVGSSCLTLVDLAGSERMTRCSAARVRQPEGAAELQTRKLRCAESTVINKSLFFLSLCFGSLIKQDERRCGEVTAATTVSGIADIPIPYRYSNLTRILARSLHCDSSIVLLVTLNPASHATQQSFHSLDFAHRASYLREKQAKKEEATKKHFPLQHQELLKQYELRRAAESLKFTQWRAASCDGLEGQGAAKQQELQSKFNLVTNVSRRKAKRHADDLQRSLPAGEKKHPSSQETSDGAVDSRTPKGFEQLRCFEVAEILTNGRLSTDCERSSEALGGIAQVHSACDDRLLDEASFTVLSSGQEIPVVGVRLAGTEGSKKEITLAAAESRPPQRTLGKVAEIRTSITGQQTVSERLATSGKGQRAQAAFFQHVGFARGGRDCILQIPFVVHHHQLVALPLSLHGPAVSQQLTHIGSHFKRQQWLPKVPIYQSAIQRFAPPYSLQERYSPTYTGRGLYTYPGSQQMPRGPPLTEPLQIWSHCVPNNCGEELFYGQKGTLLPTVRAFTSHSGQFFTASRQPVEQLQCLMT